jgi:hypothetical protein
MFLLHRLKWLVAAVCLASPVLAQSSDAQMESFLEEIGKNPPGLHSMTPSSSASSGSSASRPAIAPTRRWGAVAAAIWRRRGIVQIAIGSAVRYPSKAAARRAALQQCRRRAGRRCKVASSWNIGCGYIVTGRKRSGAGWAVGKTMAEARRKCRARGYRCKKPIGGCVS